MSFRTPPTNLFQIFCEIILNLQIIVITIMDTDEFLQEILRTKGLKKIPLHRAGYTRLNGLR